MYVYRSLSLCPSSPSPGRYGLGVSRHLAIAAILCLLPIGAVAGKKKTAPKTVLPCDWEPGASWTYEATKSREDSRRPLPFEMVSRTPVSVEVVGSAPAVFAWTHGETTMEGVPAEQREALEAVRALSAINARMRLEVVVDKGLVQGIRNLEEVAPIVEEAMKALLPDQPPEATSLFSNPEALAPILLRDIAPFFTMTCTDMSVGEEISGDTLLPNPLGGAPIPAIETYTLLQANGKTATYRFTLQLDPEAASKSLEEAVTVLSGSGNMPELPALESTTVSTFEMSLRDGMPVKGQVERTNSVLDTRMVDRWGWVRK